MFQEEKLVKFDYLTKVGGSSSLNAMIYTRGHKLDFDEFGKNNSGWNWASVL